MQADVALGGNVRTFSDSHMNRRRSMRHSLSVSMLFKWSFGRRGTFFYLALGHGHAFWARSGGTYYGQHGIRRVRVQLCSARTPSCRLLGRFFRQVDCFLIGTLPMSWFTVVFIVFADPLRCWHSFGALCSQELLRTKRYVASLAF